MSHEYHRSKLAVSKVTGARPDIHDKLCQAVCLHLAQTCQEVKSHGLDFLGTVQYLDLQSFHQICLFSRYLH